MHSNGYIQDKANSLFCLLVITCFHWFSSMYLQIMFSYELLEMDALSSNSIPDLPIYCGYISVAFSI